MKPVRSYCLRIWFTSILIAPVIILVAQLPSGVEINFFSAPLWSMLQLISYMFYMIFFGLLLLVPVFILFYLITSVLSKLILNRNLVKITLSVISIALFVLLFFLLFHPMSLLNKRSFIPYLAYPLLILSGIWFYKLNADKSIITE
ncbi:hypothetical protein SAMN05192574_11821 [Mucilaginibacter gossypiicola]|uniref:Uncharacterized protein n=1 Tax=Mucilaginibacter gossypiicola TaxID=551995 RepID=A0A1H8U5C5_9SPHI|nr:hypothetical protein SAMN05192574_11821 [Mucilaginibacter gossypiicola]